MASVKSLLQRKLKKVLTKRFPPPAIIKLDEHRGIIGVVTSPDFAAIDTIDRQDLIDKLPAEFLTPEERRQILVIVAVTPDEEIGYLASVD
jgi:hypothetical protein